MRIVVCPDKFRGTATAGEVVAVATEVLVGAGHSVDGRPMADGGEGTLVDIDDWERDSFEEMIRNNPKVVIPQDVANSALHFRMNSTQANVKMPPIGKDVVDAAGLQLIEEWINSLTPNTANPPEAV